ncbi:MAG: hypothetical protein NVV59_08970 [Chitinophagaceae bacterium]|nr:hypothetical protein [Chitinophagaceae bacterium]
MCWKPGKSCNPIIFLSAGCDSLWVGYFNAQMGTSYSYFQIDSLYRKCNIKLDPCQVQADCKTLKKLLLAYENADSLACAPAGLNPVDNCQDCFTWFVNDKLGTSYNNSQLAQLYFNNCGVILQLCGPAFNCKELAKVTNQFTSWLQANPGSGSCDSLFTIQFNAHFGLSYNYSQILSVYKKYCGKTLEFCGAAPPVSPQQLLDIKQSFQQLYPDPAKYFGDSCSSAFVRFYNAIAGDTLSYESIRMRYILVADADLNICAPDTCLQRKELVERFNTLFGGYQWPQALARDLYTALYNQTYKPIQPYNWKDVKRWYLNDTCGATLPDFAADSTYPLTCTNLQGAMRAFSILYSTATPDNCGKLFVGMVNTYFGTSFTSLDQLQQWADDNCSGLQLKICGGALTQKTVSLRSLAVPVTSVIGPRLCNSGTIVPEVNVNENDVCDYQHTMALHLATQQYQAYVQQQFENFDSTYRSQCLNAGTQEIFTVRAQAAEYHFTLYYYDRAGNLVKTVPPAGVDLSNMSNETDYEEWHESVKSAREEDASLLPAHALVTHYRYNSLNQVVAQSSPDGGLSNFWYDRLGRLVVSQNARQKNQDKYSYTMYDVLGRITEVGQIEAEEMSQELTQNPLLLGAWFAENAASREQITSTYYDQKMDALCDNSILCQTNLRNRVSFTTLTDQAAHEDYASATYYTYDIHGNVDVLLQHYRSGMMHGAGHAFKKDPLQVRSGER